MRERALQLQIILLAVCISLMTAGCRAIPAAAPTSQLAQVEPPAAAEPTATATPMPAATGTAPAAPTPPASETAAAAHLCSPLENYVLEQLPEMISNPYNPPTPGSDDPHHGVDLAVLAAENQIAVEGNPVRSALAGTVAGVINDRFPYGNAVIIETPLDAFSPDWWAQAEIPTPAPTNLPGSALTCPSVPAASPPVTSQRSLYVLYGHLKQPVEHEIGESVSCGADLGTIGMSGNALAPHLHFEARVGPSGMRFPGMAHYDNSATAEEMSIYCLWRISGLFQLVDPMKVLQLAP